MFDYDFIDTVEKRYDNIFSYGGETERSFFQNVGKIINKKAFAEKGDNVFNTILKNSEEIINGEYNRKK